MNVVNKRWRGIRIVERKKRYLNGLKSIVFRSKKHTVKQKELIVLKILHEIEEGYKMWYLPITCLFLTINLIHGQNLQGYQLGETQNREKRHNNIYQFLQHVLASSSNNRFPQANSRVYFSQDAFPQQFDQNPVQDRFVVNVNQPNSLPTTIINNLHPEYFSTCPCERYIRGQNGEIECLCPNKRIFTKCRKGSVCVLQSVCDHGLLFDTQNIPQGYNSQTDLCDESSYVCCLPPAEVTIEDEYRQIYNHFVNTSVDHLNNTVTKYIINGNVYHNNGNPTTQFTAKNEKEFKYSVQPNQQGNTPNQYQTPPQKTVQTNLQKIVPNLSQNIGQNQEGNTPNQYPSVPQTVLLSAESQFLEKPQILVSGNSVPVNSARVYSGNANSIPQTSDFVNTVPVNFGSANSVVQLNLNPSTTTTERPSSFHTIPPNLVRPIQPANEDQQNSFQNNQNSFTNDITTFRPTTPYVPVVSTGSDLLQPNEIASIFGSPNQPQNDPDKTVFPGLGVNLQANTNEITTKTSVEVSLQNTYILSMMDFPQSSLQVPMKKLESFLTGKIGTIRNTNRTNATTANQKGIGTRSYTETPQVTNVFPTNAPAFNQVTGQSSNFQEERLITSNFRVAASTNPILKTCPSDMKCIQNIYCSPEGFLTTVHVILSKEEEDKKNLLLNCGDESSGQIGKCCFDRNA